MWKYDEEMEFKLVGSTEANSLQNKISNESPVGQALMGKKAGDVVDVETQAGDDPVQGAGNPEGFINYTKDELRTAEQNQQKKGNQAEQDLNQLLKVRREKLAELQANGKDPFQITKYDVTVHSTDVKDNFETMGRKEVSIAGRMMSKRVMGKGFFL